MERYNKENKMAPNAIIHFVLYFFVIGGMLWFLNLITKDNQGFFAQTINSLLGRNPISKLASQPLPQQTRLVPPRYETVPNGDEQPQEQPQRQEQGIIYKWADSKGQTHYSNNNPGNDAIAISTYNKNTRTATPNNSKVIVSQAYNNYNASNYQATEYGILEKERERQKNCNEWRQRQANALSFSENIDMETMLQVKKWCNQ